MNAFAKKRPYLFAIAAFLVNSALAVPFVAAARILGTETELLRLIIPAAQSALMIWILYALGWLRSAGFGTRIQDIHVLGYPAAAVILPVVLYGTIAVAAGPVTFFFSAILFTGISEEALNRGILIRALIFKGPWTAILVAAGLFSISHLSNLAFADFDVIAMGEVLLTTFGYAVLMGAVFLRTQNIWPLIVLHTLEDFFIVLSGRAGPWTVEPFPTSYHVAVAAVGIGYAVYVARKIDTRQLLAIAAEESATTR
jgi:membrane protease YdiL (CAAX protease family)